MQKKSRKIRHMLMSVLVLFICVAATTTALASRLNTYQVDDKGAISLISVASQTTTDTAEPAAETSVPETDIQSVTADGTPNANNLNADFTPGFEASDENSVWSTETQIEIFRISYENGEQNITVNSDNGEKVFAPGTGNSYTFKLKNTGNVALDYNVTVDAFFTPADVIIPITARLNRYDGLWLAGDKDNYADISALDSVQDAATLGAGKYTYYTLDWQWPFESGDDEFDTILGNMAAKGKDLTLTIVIKTTSEADYTETGSPGITPPQTGDISYTTLWISIALGSFVIMIILIVYQIVDKRMENTEAKAVEKE